MINKCFVYYDDLFLYQFVLPAAFFLSHGFLREPSMNSTDFFLMAFLENPA